MSTRANVVIKDMFDDEIWFYRHSDGYPEGVAPTLTKFMTWVKEKRIRDNATQSAGWLIIIGNDEYKKHGVHQEPNDSDKFIGWKVGAYEPSLGQHGDIDFLYILDLKKKEIESFSVDMNGKKKRIKTDF